MEPQLTLFDIALFAAAITFAVLFIVTMVLFATLGMIYEEDKERGDEIVESFLALFRSRRHHGED